MPKENIGNNTIKDIVREKRKVILVLSSDEKIEINEDIILDYYLFKDKELDDITIKNIKKSANMAEALSKAYDILSRGSYTKNELKRKLLAKKYNATIVDQVISKLLSLHYIDDYQYVNEYVNTYKDKGFGPQKIKSNLIVKGVNENILKTIAYSDEEQAQIINDLLPKLEKKFDNYNYQIKLQHIYSKLLALGFDKDIINSSLTNLKDKDDTKEQELLIKDLNKAKRKYMNIEDLRERKQRIIYYLYKKGYSYNIISNELKDDDYES